MKFINVILDQKHEKHNIVEAITSNFKMPLNERTRVLRH